MSDNNQTQDRINQPDAAEQANASLDQAIEQTTEAAASQAADLGQAATDSAEQTVTVAEQQLDAEAATGESSEPKVKADVNAAAGEQRNAAMKWAIPAVAVLVIGAIVFFMTRGGLGGNGAAFVSKDPHDRVLDGFVSLFDFEQNPQFEKHFGVNAMTERAVSEGSTLTGKFIIDSMPIVADTQGVQLPADLAISWQLTTQNKLPRQSNIDLGLHIAEQDIVALTTYIDKDVMQIAVPKLFSKVLAIDYTGDVKAKIDESPIFGSSDVDTTQIAASFEQVRKQYGQELTLEDVQNVGKQLEKYSQLIGVFDKFRKSWSVEATAAKTMIVNGKEQSFDGYNVTISKESMAVLMNDLNTAVKEDPVLREDIESFFNRSGGNLTIGEERIENVEDFYIKIDSWLTDAAEAIKTSDAPDPMITMHVDEQNRAVSVNSEYSYDDVVIIYNIEKHGGATLDENMNASIKVKNAKSQTASFTFTRSGYTDDKGNQLTLQMIGEDEGRDAFQIDVDQQVSFADNTWMTQFSFNAPEENQKILVDAKGNYSDINVGKSYTFNIESADIKANDQTVFTGHGFLSTDTSNVEIAKPEGDVLDMFTATQEDLEALGQEIQSNAIMLFFSLQQYFQ